MDAGATPLKRTALKHISERREEKRAVIGARGPLCDHVKRYACAACRRAPTDPCHIKRVGKGYGDFAWIEANGIWVGQVGPGCRACHEIMDGNRNASLEERARITRSITDQATSIARLWAKAVGVNLGLSEHPYEQLQRLGLDGPGDLSQAEGT